MMVDVCVTSIIKSTSVMTPDFSAKKFSEIISMERFEYVRPVAKMAYAMLTDAGHYCPEVKTWNDDGVILTWKAEGSIPRSFTLILSKGSATYRWTDQSETFEASQIQLLLKLAIKYLDYEIGVEDADIPDGERCDS